MVKESVNRWLVLLIVLVALSLVVELISLNVLYGISNKPISGSQGTLAASWRDDSCVQDCASQCVEWEEYWGAYVYSSSALQKQCENSCSWAEGGGAYEGDCCYYGFDPYYGCCDPNGYENGYC